MISEETRQKMREAYNQRIARGESFGFKKGHGLLRKPATEEEKQRRIKSYKETIAKKPKPSCKVCGKKLWKWKDKNCREHADYSFRKGRPSTNKGKTWKLNLTEEQKKRRTEIGKSRIMSLETREKLRAWHVSHPNRIFRDTSIELAIQDELAERQILFVKQFVIQGVARVDFFLPEYNVVIQCDGCYWHNCLEHYPGHHKEQRIKDITKDAKMKLRGLEVYRFWEHDIKNSPKDCIDLINLTNNL